MTDHPASDYDDEIDLRAIIQTLWKARLAILITTLATATLAFVVSFWIVPRQYQTSAVVLIRQPLLGTSAQTPELTFTARVPDLITLTKLAVAPKNLESVLKDPAVAAALGSQAINLSSMATAAALGTDQLSLRITATDPQRAALLANTWAKKVAETVNSNYSLDAQAQALASQVLQSQKAYQAAQAEYEDLRSKSRVDVLGAQLKNKQTDLSCVLALQSLTARVLDDLQTLEQGLNSAPAESSLSLDDGLVLTTLRQRSLTSQPCQPAEPAGQFAQIDSAARAESTISNALQAAARMRAELQARLPRLQSEQSRLEQEIPTLNNELLDEQTQLDQEGLKRDQSWDVYTALLQQQEWLTTLEQSDQEVASLGEEAVIPSTASSPNPLKNTALAGMAGLILSMLGALALNWWRETGS